MPIVATDLKRLLSGGAGNTDPAAALGGAASTTEVVDATVGNLFAIVDDSESAAGSTKYRCLYVKNTHATLSLQSARILLTSNTPSADTTCRIALGTSAVGGVEQTIANETTAPVGVAWSAVTGEGGALSIGTLPPGGTKAVWVERVVAAGAAAYDTDSVVVSLVGGTAQ